MSRVGSRNGTGSIVVHVITNLMRHLETNTGVDALELMLKAGLAAIAAIGAAALSPTAAYAQPEGSYTQSCRDVQVREGRGPNATLSATCPDQRGRWRRSTLDLHRCGGDIHNRNGRLACAGDGVAQGSGSGLGPGHGRWTRSTITLYDQRNFRGRSRTFDGPIDDLRQLGLNDRTSSVVVEGRRGAWQLCDNAGFSGQCVTVTGQLNLNRVGLDDRVSSLRPVR